MSNFHHSFNPKIDAYITNAALFAQPILTHLRALIHKACPGVVEEIKWSRPFFSHRGEILCNISAFKTHCSLGFWGDEMGKVLRAANVLEGGAMGSFGRIATPGDLPPDKALIAYLRQAAAFIEAGQGANRMVIARRRVVKPPKPEVETPPEFAAALKRSEAAAAVFAAFSPSCKREYVEWIVDAKRPETRERRIAQAVEWIALGRQRNWQYQSC